MRIARQIILLMTLASLLAGCQVRKRKDAIRPGRTAGGPISKNHNQYGCLNPYIVNGASWGEITQGFSSNFQSAVYLLTLPHLDGLPVNEQLGNVSGVSGQSTGVRFWGQVGFNGAQVQTNSSLHIEVYDDRYCTPGPNGKSINQVVLHIGPAMQGFQYAAGTVNNNMASLTFVSVYYSVTLYGYIQNQWFTGDIYFKNSYTQGEDVYLGQFQVPTCGFFKCQ